MAVMQARSGQSRVKDDAGTTLALGWRTLSPGTAPGWKLPWTHTPSWRKCSQRVWQAGQA